MAPVEVCAAVIRRGATVLLATRPPGSRLAGRWEFPGGKLHQGESLAEGIRREIAEELRLTVLDAQLLDTVEPAGHTPPIRLHFLECQVDPTAEPVCQEGQQARWFALDELDHLDLLPADRGFAQRWRRGGLPPRPRGEV